ncbi:hypothetical protein [Pseudoalteromonas haloplanktis]|nr:hypothetical protein [Pseudoalteromonas haloplanktis]
MFYKRLIPIALGGLFFANSVAAFTANYTLTGETLVAHNVVPYSNGISVLSDWKPVSGISPTQQWQAGQISSSVSELRLTNTQDATKSFVLTLNLKGVSYNAVDNFESVSTNTIYSAGSPCDNTIPTGNIFDVMQSNSTTLYPMPECISSYSVSSTLSKQPFYFVRPIFDIPEDALKQALSVSATPSMPEGTYTGSIPIAIKYYYKTSAGVTTYRIIRDQFSVQINYIPSYLTSVTIAGDGILDPVYDTSAHTVTSSVSSGIFTVTAQGMFANGLRMLFDESHKYVMTSDDGVELPYSLKCSTCQPTQIVSSGVLQETAIIAPGENVSQIIYDLQFSYHNISVTDVETGKYTDQVTIIFEEVL